MYEKTIFSINTEKMAKESLSIVMEEINEAAENGQFELNTKLFMPPKTIRMLMDLKYEIMYTEQGTTLISWRISSGPEAPKKSQKLFIKK